MCYIYHFEEFKISKEINNILKELNYVDVDEINDMVAINIDIARRNLVDLIC